MPDHHISEEELASLLEKMGIAEPEASPPPPPPPEAPAFGSAPAEGGLSAYELAALLGEVKSSVTTGHATSQVWADQGLLPGESQDTTSLQISEAELVALMGGGPDSAAGSAWADKSLPPATAPHAPGPAISDNELAALLGGLDEMGRDEVLSTPLPPPTKPRPATAAPPAAPPPEKQLSQSEIDAMLARLMGG